MAVKQPSVFEKLRAPFAPELVSWRAQTVYGSKALALAYIDARDVMRRLDEAVGPENWATTYEETSRGRMLCRLSIRVGDEWIMKTDGAGETDVEGDKGAISDALKRAAVNWGIGRYLYDTPTVWAPCEVQERNGKNVWKAWKQPEAGDMFAKALDGIAPDPEPKANGHTRLKAEIRQFVREMEACGDWDMWCAFRDMPESQRIMRECEAEMPEWWETGKGMGADFIPLAKRISTMEARFADNFAAIGRT